MKVGDVVEEKISGWKVVLIREERPFLAIFGNKNPKKWYGKKLTIVGEQNGVLQGYWSFDYFRESELAEILVF